MDSFVVNKCEKCPMFISDDYSGYDYCGHPKYEDVAVIIEDTSLIHKDCPLKEEPITIKLN